MRVVDKSMDCVAVRLPLPLGYHGTRCIRKIELIGISYNTSSDWYRKMESDSQGHDQSGLMSPIGMTLTSMTETKLGPVDKSQLQMNHGQDQIKRLPVAPQCQMTVRGKEADGRGGERETEQG